jgi:hypothetical protein
MDNFRWYDYVAVYLIADVGAALIMVILSGLVIGVMMLPLLVLAWLSYENVRVTGFGNDKEPD